MRWWEGCDVVRCGFWINWSSDSVHGSTLTLPREWAMILVAFLALFVKLAGSYLWGIICFAIHQVNASSRLQDDMYHHFQLVLRNSESESSFIGKLLTVGSAHKGARFEAYRRTLWPITLAALHGIGIWAASTLSSRFITRGDEVQAVPGKCGWMREISMNALTDEESFETFSSLVVMTRHGYRRSAAYSRACYAQIGTNSTICASYKQIALPYNTSLSAPCPFDGKICNGSAITFDTGHLLSDEHLGINTRPEDAISMRKVLTCVPLAGEQYADGWQEVPFDYANPNSTDLARCYKLGATAMPFPGVTACVWGNSLFWGDQPYNVRSFSAFINYEGDQTFLIEPIPELQSSDSDFTLIGLINRVAYRTPVEDHWFNAQNLTRVEMPSARDAFTATNAMSFMGCQESYQLCAVDGSYCSPFTGIHDIDPENSTGLNPTQLALFRLLWKVGWMAQLSFQLIFVGRENLIANDYLWVDRAYFGFSASLPSDQWHREVTNWMNTSLAMLQRATYTYARPTEFDVGPGIPALKYIDEPNDEHMKLLCHKIKVRSQSHQSFSVLGLFLILALALTIIALKTSLPTIMSYSQKRTGKGPHKRLEWIETSAFQLQRMAAEGRGIGPWNGREDNVPTLAEYGHLFNLTMLSLRGKWSRADSCEVVSRGVNNNDDEEVEMDCLEGGASNLRVMERVDTDGSQMRLLGP